MSVTTKGIVSGLSGIVDSLRNRGGIISNFGKPEKIVYDECSRWLSGLQPSRVLAIGDQIGSDILGANRRGYQRRLFREPVQLRILLVLLRNSANPS
jgi:ribonucleotide monophosphatase NagD (HAD superfamily)